MTGEQGKILKDAENYGLMGCYSASSGNFLGTFQDNLSVPFSASSNIPHSGRIAYCPAPDPQQPATKAQHTIGSNKTHIVSSSWWWA